MKGRPEKKGTWFVKSGEASFESRPIFKWKKTSDVGEGNNVHEHEKGKTNAEGKEKGVRKKHSRGTRSGTLHLRLTKGIRA